MGAALLLATLTGLLPAMATAAGTCPSTPHLAVVLDRPAMDRVGNAATRDLLATVLARTGPESIVSLHPVGVAGNDRVHTLSARPGHTIRERKLLAPSFLHHLAVAPHAPDREARLEDVFASLSTQSGCPRIVLLVTDFPERPKGGMIRDAALDLSQSLVLAVIPEDDQQSRARTRWRRRVESGGGRWFAVHNPADAEAALNAAAISPWREGSEAPTSP